MSVVLDASAILAFLKDEPGADVVERHLVDGAICSTVHWSEVAQKVRAAHRDWTLAGALLRSYHIGVEPVSEADAEWAAARWQLGEGLSIADRLCLALGHRTAFPIWTADAAWGTGKGIHQIR